jgi:translation elongation factor EF-4
VERIGVITPEAGGHESLGPGEIGFITASIKEVADTRVGDTVTEEKRPTAKRCPASSRHSRWCLRLLPRRCGGFEDLRAAMGKLRLNDASSRSRWKPQPRSASASAAASSGFAPGNHSGAAGARVQSST